VDRIVIAADRREEQNIRVGNGLRERRAIPDGERFEGLGFVEHPASRS